MTENFILALGILILIGVTAFGLRRVKRDSLHRRPSTLKKPRPRLENKMPAYRRRYVGMGVNPHYL